MTGLTDHELKAINRIIARLEPSQRERMVTARLQVIIDRLPPGLLYALLNLPVVKRQMRSKQFTRDVIDTLGRRFLDVVLPLPHEAEFRDAIGAFVLDACRQRVQARAVMSRLCKDLFDLAKDPAALIR